jgi:acyl-CoA synthetase (AMP-forming)/AMP-acid ligase II
VTADTLHGLLDVRAAEHGDRDFVVVVGGGRHSFAAVAALGRRVATGLTSLGVGPGDRVAVAAPNGIEWLGVLFGAARLGAVVVTLSTRYRERELDVMLNDSGAKVLVCPAQVPGFDLAGFLDGFRPRIPTVEHVVFVGGAGSPGGRTFDELAAADPAVDEPRGVGVTGADPAVILYTSGTTGTPKGAVLTHAGLLASARAQADHFASGPTTRSVSSMPLNHVGGLTCSLLSLLVAGGCWIMLPTFSPAATLAAVAGHGATDLSGVPTMWVLMLDHLAAEPVDLSSVRRAVVGGSALDPDLGRRILEAVPGARLTNLYGLSETSGAVIVSAAEDDLPTVTRSIGVPIGDVAVRVVAADGTELPAGAVGELHVRTASAAAGYWRRPEASADTFLPGGWVATGDVVEVDPDGHVVLRGRVKEMWIQGGYNVYPAEVEAVLTLHPDVTVAAGIGIPDAVLGEVGKYFVIPRPGAVPDVGELSAWCAARLASYKVPRQIVLVDDLPLTPAGKVAKAALRPAAGGQPAGSQPAGSQPAGSQPAGSQPAGSQPGDETTGYQTAR